MVISVLLFSGTSNTRRLDCLTYIHLSTETFAREQKWHVAYS